MSAQHKISIENYQVIIAKRQCYLFQNCFPKIGIENIGLRTQKITHHLAIGCHISL